MEWTSRKIWNSCYRFHIQKTLTPSGISAENVVAMNNEWAFILQITSKTGKPSHCICIYNRVIYNANSETTLPKTLANFRLCAQLHIPSSTNQFYCTRWIRCLIPKNMVLKKILVVIQFYQNETDGNSMIHQVNVFFVVK